MHGRFERPPDFPICIYQRGFQRTRKTLSLLNNSCNTANRLPAVFLHRQRVQMILIYGRLPLSIYWLLFFTACLRLRVLDDREHGARLRVLDVTPVSAFSTTASKTRPRKTASQWLDRMEPRGSASRIAIVTPTALGRVVRRPRCCQPRTRPVRNAQVCRKRRARQGQLHREASAPARSFVLSSRHKVASASRSPCSPKEVRTVRSWHGFRERFPSRPHTEVGGSRDSQSQTHAAYFSTDKR